MIGSAAIYIIKPIINDIMVLYPPLFYAVIAHVINVFDTTAYFFRSFIIMRPPLFSCKYL